jgi:hypothetical protein
MTQMRFIQEITQYTLINKKSPKLATEEKINNE